MKINEQDLTEELAELRLTMTVNQIAKLTGRNPIYIKKLTDDHPDKDKFFVDTRTVGQKHSERLTEARKKIKKSDPFKKGYAKIDTSKQTEVVIKDNGPKRKVKIDSKTETFVSADDKRTDAQVIEDFKRKFNK